MSDSTAEQPEASGASGESPDANAHAKRYRRSDVFSFPAGEGLELVYCRANRTASLLPTNVVGLLNHCNEFRTLDDHAAVISLAFELSQDRTAPLVSELSANKLSAPAARLLERFRSFAYKQKSKLEVHQSHIESIKQELQKFVEAGLLISDADLTARHARPDSRQESHDRIVTIGVPTRDRPDSLRRCLTSYMENCKRHRRNTDFVVVDDSEDRASREDAKQVLGLLKVEHDAQVAYAGYEEKKKYAEELAAEGGLSPDVVTFALFGVESCGHTIGANRNALLLHTVGDMVFSADDDTVCSVTASPEVVGDGLAFHSGVEPTDFWFFADREAALGSVTVQDEDILGMHERLLGKNLSECVETWGTSSTLNLDRADPQLVRELQSGRGKVLLTMSGLVGDSGMWSPMWLLTLTGNSFERLAKSKLAYDSAFTSREVMRVVNRTTISSGNFCMAYALGLDNRTLLPPFFPVYRNEDALFATTLRLCFERGYIGYVPWAVMHLTQPRSYTQADAWEKPFTHRVYDVVFACLQSFTFPAGLMGEAESLRALGRHFISLGNSNPTDFDEFVRVGLWQMKSTSIAILEEELNSRKAAPDFWSADVVKSIELLRRSLLDETHKPPRELLEGRSVDEARRLMKSLIYKFGQLLDCWPEMVASAGNLRARGVRLGTPL